MQDRKNTPRLETEVVSFSNSQMPNVPKDIQTEISGCCKMPVNYTADGTPYCSSCKRGYVESRIVRI